MKLYVVERGACAYGDHTLVGVFTTRDAADAIVGDSLDYSVTEVEADRNIDWRSS